MTDPIAPTLMAAGRGWTETARGPLFEGSAVALVTPFTANGLNEEQLAELVAFHLAQGTDALLANGSTGEATTMSPDEQRRAAEVVVAAAAGRVPVMVGVGGSDTAAVARLARTAREAGASALLVSPPPYSKPPQRGIVAHMRAVMDAADLPILIYNIPGRTACNILPETVELLADDDRVIGLKEASGDLVQVAEIARRLGDRMPLYSGNDDQALAVLALGGRGIISVLANLVPADTSRLVHAFLEGRLEEARELQLRYLPLVRALFYEANPIVVKAAVRALGFDVGEVRLPLVPPTAEALAVLRDAMREAGLPLDGGR